MKRKLLFVFFLSLLSSPLLGNKKNTAPVEGLSGIYEWVYEHNTPTLSENHYIDLKVGNKKAEGTYFGTSDDFDEAREGYLPGFFKASMTDLELSGSTIRFKVTVNKGDFWTTPVTPFSKGKRGKAWEIDLGKRERLYTGVISGNQITIDNLESGPRTFVKRK